MSKKRLIFDIETNSIDSPTKVHCIATLDLDTGEHHLYVGMEEVAKSCLPFLLSCDELIGHNVVAYDIPVLEKLFNVSFENKITDTLILSNLIYPDLKDIDLKKKIPLGGKLIGSASLEAWGKRLGEYKDDFGKTTDWLEYTEEMGKYCLQDVIVTRKLYNVLMKDGYSKEAIELEHEVAKIIKKQVENGFEFNQKEAEKVYLQLMQRREELIKTLRDTFQPFVIRTPFTPKVNNAKRGYVKGVETYKEEIIEFNPSSRDHIAKVLKEQYNWLPTVFTPSGKPKVDEDSLKGLDYPEVKLIAEYLMLDKRIGQLAEGNQAWLKLIKSDGRIHGRLITNGTPTGRARHMNPNVSQVPKAKLPWGKELRGLWTVRAGYKLVDCDASQLELRCLAHYLSMWDNGEYTKLITEGDVHIYNQKAAGLETRDDAKKMIYMLIYGSGTENLGNTFGKSKAYGIKLKKNFMKNVPAFKELTETVSKKVEERGYLIGLDGRKIPVRSAHSALNFLLQGAGAIIMKQAMILVHRKLQRETKLIEGVDYMQVAWIHDAFDFEVKEEYAEMVGEIVKQAIIEAGEHFKLKCPMDGEYHIGNNWSEVH